MVHEHEVTGELAICPASIAFRITLIAQGSGLFRLADGHGFSSNRQRLISLFDQIHDPFQKFIHQTDLTSVPPRFCFGDAID